MTEMTRSVAEQAVLSPPIASDSNADWRQESWRRRELALAIGGAFVIALRIDVTPQLITVGDVFAVVLAPLWLPVLRCYVGARALFILGALAAASGLLLTYLHSANHEVSLGRAVTGTALLVSLFLSVGFLLWARQRMSEGALVLVVGAGLLLGVQTDTDLFPTNPWKFGIGLPVTLILIALTQLIRRRSLQLAVVAILCVVSALTDARSAFAVLLLTTFMLMWQFRPQLRSRRRSVVLAVLGLLLSAVVVYNLVQAAILSGALGAETQARSERQINASGSLLFGGRPEIAATLALMRHHPWGFGSGTQPNLSDINTAKAGMATLGYDPNNGYVERWMFGGNYALHSTFGDLWAQHGLAGLALCAAVLTIVVVRLGGGITSRTASTALVFLSTQTLWNLFFSPFYSSLTALILLLVVALAQREESGASSAPP